MLKNIFISVTFYFIFFINTSYFCDDKCILLKIEFFIKYVIELGFYSVYIYF